MRRTGAAVLCLVCLSGCTALRDGDALPASAEDASTSDAQGAQDASTSDAQDAAQSGDSSSGGHETAPPRAGANAGSGEGGAGASGSYAAGAGASGSYTAGAGAGQGGAAGTPSSTPPLAACPTPGSANLLAKQGSVTLPQQQDGYLVIASNGCDDVQAPATTVVATFVLTNPTPYWQNIECWLRSRLHSDALQSSVQAESSISVSLQVANRGGAGLGDAETKLECRNVENLGHVLSASSIKLLTEAHERAVVVEAPQ